MAGFLYTPDLLREADEQIWFRYCQQEYGVPEIKIYTFIGENLQKTISGLGDRPEGTYASRSRAIFWNKRDTGGNLLGAAQYYADLYIDSVKYDRVFFTLT